MAGDRPEAGVQPELVSGAAHESTTTTTSTQQPAPEAAALATRYQHLSLAAQTVHADDFLNSHPAVAPPMHTSTTFRYSDDPDLLRSWANVNPANPHDSHVYSRDSAPNTTRLEAILSSILRGPALTYSSGLAAFHALLVRLNPRRVAIGGGYHGCHGVLALMARLTGLQVLDLDCAEADLGPGDLLHVETPVNPTGEARDLERYAARARRAGALLSVDATLAPPPLLDPFAWGADLVLHSGTKYLGGHADLLCGVLAVAPRHAAAWVPRLRADRLLLGAVMGSLEGWLGVRSLRTLELRVARQSAGAAALVAWLEGERVAAAAAAANNNTNKEKAASAAGRCVAGVRHASLQAAALRAEAKKDDDEPAAAATWLERQMPAGFGPVFAVYLGREADARRLPSKLRLFHHATSLGGVESLVEWRAMTDAGVDRRLLRVSVGVEAWEDLRDDLAQAFAALEREREGRGGEEEEE
ncbi:cystathionine beta-lyase [Xylariomycetidae sp. FL0641]|nr:cystathionine beta-lyase [Xylariomycetidae sp. FL0641]